MHGAEYVTLPLWIVRHEGIPDQDVRVLLILDQMGWREGRRDGIIMASNAEIARRINRKTWAVARSLQRLAALDGQILSYEMVSPTRRGPITLLYERLGRPRHDAPAIVQESSSDAPSLVQISSSGDAALVQKSSSLELICTSLPIRELEREEEDDDEALVQISSSASDIGKSPETVAEVMSWLPCIGVDARDAERLALKVPAWVRRIAKRHPQHAAAAVDWVVDALISACDKDDIVAYAEATLKGYAQAGGRKDVELAPAPLAVPDETDTPAPAVARNGTHPARQTKADRDAAKYAANLDAFAKAFGTKETADGPR